MSDTDTASSDADERARSGSPPDGETNATRPTDATTTDRGPDGTLSDATKSGDTPPLRVTDLYKSFGGITAVDGTSFEIEEGKITGLIGPNGAGKSTTFNLITGFLSPDSGTVELYGEDVTGMQPYTIADKGMVRTFQIARELSEMTVLENMMLAPKHQRGEALWRTIVPGARKQVQRDEEEVLERAWEMLDFFDIDHLAEEYSGNLSGGQRKLLEMARALMTDPDVLLLDEPFAGVNPSLEEKLLDHVHDLRDQGYTFLLVEHDIDLIMNNCSRVLVLHQGKLLADGPPEAIRSDERVIEAYLGGEVE